MNERIEHFTDSADWWKETPEHFEECDVGTNVLEVTQAIKRELAKIPSEKAQIQQLQQELAGMKRDIAVLQSAIFPPLGPRDDFALWTESDEAAGYVGLFVAFVPGVGPIASAKTIRELRPLIRAHESGNKAVIASVPDAAH